jgi:hypothetical protein
MIRFVLVSCILLITAVSLNAQSAQPIPPSPPPQSPRQALLEMFLGTAPDHLEKHLPEIAKKAFHKLQSGGDMTYLTEISSMGAQVKATPGLQIMETGPVLLSVEQPGSNQKFDVVVESDDLVGDEDEIDLSFHLYKNGQQEILPILPRLTFMMKTESRIWRLDEITFSARMPLGDADFLKDLVKDLEEKQRSRNDTMASFSIRMIVNAENHYNSAHPDRGFTCSLSQLAEAGKEGEEQQGMPIDDELAAGKKNGYVFALTGCDSTHFKVAAEPAVQGGGQRAFCADEGGAIKFAKNGKATTCLTSGETLPEGSSSSID